MCGAGWHRPGVYYARYPVYDFRGYQNEMPQRGAFPSGCTWSRFGRPLLQVLLAPVTGREGLPHLHHGLSAGTGVNLNARREVGQADGRRRVGALNPGLGHEIRPGLPQLRYGGFQGGYAVLKARHGK